ncbi:uncharacterized protein CDAR_437901 [Caerostris darwini]|uniref:Chitin-binding type-2 domain-containing protein n=1 Tax=Caerostris darwini TaxID=1538125 RepID=A0AAV4NY67_9ARAC|nr:uncharacterized protein CDAR_437901 [Caerostris darwini]
MSKVTSFLVLFVAVILCAEAILIYPEPMPSSGSDNTPNLRKNDPRCKEKDGIFANPKDCTMYLKCVEGTGQDLHCPEGFKFDTYQHCTPNTTADCGRRRVRALKEDLECPDDYGWFPYKADCHKYIVCIMGYPHLRTCPKHYVYRDTNGACVEGDECPKSESGPVHVVCQEEDGLFPHPSDCRKYIKCVNGYPDIKYCKPDKAFDPETKTCTRERLAHCPVYVVCQEEDGLFPDPSDCRSYSKCVNGYPDLKYCKPDKAFDPEKKKCTRERLAHCRNNQIHSVL